MLAASASIIALMLLAVSAFVWREHQLALEKTGERATRLAGRLAQDLEQTLTVARTVISQVDVQLQRSPADTPRPPSLAAPNAFAALLASLPLPFDLHAVDATGNPIAIVGTLAQPPIGVHHHPHGHSSVLSTERWGLSNANPAWSEKVVPLTWKAAGNNRSVEAYGVDLELTALSNWLERDRLEPDDRVTLFWLNADGSATVMARAPTVAADLGKSVRAPWVQVANQTPSGLVDQLSALDGMPRRIAFQRLGGAASDMVVVYGAGTHMALEDWRAKLPFFMGLALFLLAAMSYGAWRLDRSLKALTQSERHFQLMLDSGNVWDWNIAEKTVRYSPMFLTALGFGEVPLERMASTLFKAVHPEDIDNLKTALMRHIKERAPYACAFRIRDANGQYRWFETKGQAFWDDAGQAKYMAGTTFEITERVALEEAQRQTLQRLDIVANASPVLFCTSNLHGEVDWLNRRWLAFTGRTAEQEMGQGWLAGVHPDDLPRRQAFFASVTTRQEAVSTEFRLRDKDGIYRWMVVQCLPLRNADGGINGFIVSCIDISELKQAEDAARQRGAMLEAVFNVLQDLLFVVDQDGRFIYFQGASNDQLYVPPEAFLGKTAREVMPGPIAELIHEQLTRAEKDQLQEFDYRLTLPDGEHHFDARMARLPDSEHYMVVARDITERESLIQQRGRLQQFLILQLRLASRFINHPLDSIDAEIDRALGEIGEFVQADRAYIFIYNMQAYTASNSHEWCASGIEPAIEQLQDLSMNLIPAWVDAHMQGKALWVDDVQALPEGKLREILEPQSIRSLITLPMNSAQGLLGFVGFDSVRARHNYDQEEISLLHLFAQMLVNVRERRQAEARLRDFAAELEIRVKDRTQQLDTSVKRLSQANQELQSFAYSVSHDLKAPLRSVEGFASLLQSEHSAELNAEGRDYLDRIQHAALHMARLISDLLAYCRMEELDKQIVPVPLREVVNDVLDGMRNELDTLGVKIHMNVQDDIQALAHPQGLTMVLRNLIDNAIKFTIPGNVPEITLTARNAGDKTLLCVKDEGQGFDMRYHDRIFAIFQRLHRPEVIAGTGIGLAMVQKAIQRMNGRIWAESEPGKGAKFHIELPRA